MKFIGKVLLTLLLVLVLFLVAIYLILQTQWGAKWLSNTVTDNTGYQVSFSKLEHNFSSPMLITLDNLTLGRKNQAAFLRAERVDLGLSSLQFSQPLHFASIRLEKGMLDLQPAASPLPFEADRLQLKQMSLNHHGQTFTVSARGVDGGVLPWKPQAGNVIGNEANFQMSAGALTLNGVEAENVLLQGRTNHQQWILSNLGADVARGSVTGSAQRDEQGRWEVSNLRLNSIRLRRDLPLTDFFKPLLALPSIQINRLDVTDARLEGTDWAVTDMDLALKNVTLRDGDWESDDGSLSMNASTFVNGSLQLDDPIVNMTFSQQGITLSQFSSRWVNGLIRTNGTWSHETKKLTLDELAIAGIEYTLPQEWRARWMEKLPAWLASVEVTKLSMNRNLIIDINPAFPFQLTSLDGNGANLVMARDHLWGIWSGSMNFNAAEATFNRIDLRHPSVALTADANNINVTEMSAFTHQGMVESLATLSQQPSRDLSLTANARNVPVNLLKEWGWPTVPLEGEGNLQLKLNGNLTAAPLKPTVNGTLSAQAGETSLQQTLRAGQLVSE